MTQARILVTRDNAVARLPVKGLGSATRVPMAPGFPLLPSARALNIETNRNQMKKATTTAGSAPASKPKAAAAKRATGTAVKAAKPKAAASASPSTSVTARIDVGFGNLLYIRGDGPGLSWDRGALMECESSDSWTWATPASRPFAFKVLINDERWSNGDDFIASVGTENSVTPEF